MSELTIGCVGFSANEQLVLRSMIRVTASRCSDKWQFCASSEEATVVILADNADSEEIENRKISPRFAVRAGVAPNHSASTPITSTTPSMPLTLSVPFRANALIDLLNQVGSTIRTQEQQRQDLATEVRPAGFADVIAQIVVLSQSEAALPARIVIGQAPPITISRFLDMFQWSSADAGDFSRAMRSARSGGVISISPDHALPASEPGARGPLIEFIWALASQEPEPPAIPGDPSNPVFQLGSWPPLGGHNRDPLHLRLASAMSRAALSLDQLIAISGGNAVDVHRFLNACKHCGVLSAQQETRVDAPKRNDVAPENKSRHGDAVSDGAHRTGKRLVTLLRTALGLGT